MLAPEELETRKTELDSLSAHFNIVEANRSRNDSIVLINAAMAYFNKAAEFFQSPAPIEDKAKTGLCANNIDERCRAAMRDKYSGPVSTLSNALFYAAAIEPEATNDLASYWILSNKTSLIDSEPFVPKDSIRTIALRAGLALLSRDISSCKSELKQAITALLKCRTNEATSKAEFAHAGMTLHDLGDEIITEIYKSGKDYKDKEERKKLWEDFKLSDLHTELTTRIQLCYQIEEIVEVSSSSRRRQRQAAFSSDLAKISDHPLKPDNLSSTAPSTTGQRRKPVTDNSTAAITSPTTAASSTASLGSPPRQPTSGQKRKRVTDNRTTAITSPTTTASITPSDPKLTSEEEDIVSEPESHFLVDDTKARKQTSISVAAALKAMDIPRQEAYDAITELREELQTGLDDGRKRPPPNRRLNPSTAANRAMGRLAGSEWIRLPPEAYLPSRREPLGPATIAPASYRPTRPIEDDSNGYPISYFFRPYETTDHASDSSEDEQSYLSSSLEAQTSLSAGNPSAYSFERPALPYVAASSATDSSNVSLPASFGTESSVTYSSHERPPAPPAAVNSVMLSNSQPSYYTPFTDHLIATSRFYQAQLEIALQQVTACIALFQTTQTIAYANDLVVPPVIPSSALTCFDFSQACTDSTRDDKPSHDNEQ